MTPHGTKGKTLVMGIVNVTPDSFSDGGSYLHVDDAVQHAMDLVHQGADILDVGAESTRPGGTQVDEEVEWRRLEPVLKQLTACSPVPISVDTYKASVARRALSLGVRIINDVWGGLADEEMLPLIAKARCTYIWMHNRAKPADGDAVETLMAETRQGVERCLDAGVAPESLWIDPGIGFGKTSEQNLEVLQDLQAYCRMGWPVLLGASRKSFIGKAIGGEPSARLEGSLAVAAWGVSQGVRAVRVHDVSATVQTCRMTEAILHGHF